MKPNITPDFSVADEARGRRTPVPLSRRLMIASLQVDEVTGSLRENFTAGISADVELAERPKLDIQSNHPRA